jgi:CHAD domain-containing protein
VQVKTFDHLIGSAATLSEQLSPLRSGLTDVAKQHRVNGLRQIPRVIGFLKKAHREVSKWKLGDLEGKDLKRRIRRTYRRGRSTLDLAIAAGDTETFHTWRKLVKQLWYQLRITNRFWTDRAVPLIAEIGAIGELAGEERDLTILSGTIRHGAKSAASLELLDLIEARRSQLRAKAVSTGEIFYEKKPKAFVEGLDL